MASRADGSGARRLSLVRGLLLPDGADDTREFIGDREGGFVVAAAQFHGQRPALEPVALSSPRAFSGV